jgi:hypothetical protein
MELDKAGNESQIVNSIGIGCWEHLNGAYFDRRIRRTKKQHQKQEMKTERTWDEKSKRVNTPLWLITA